MLSFQAPASSDRLTLRPFSPADLDDVSLFQSDPLVLPFIPWTLRSRQETREWLERQADSEVRAEGESGTWAVVRRSDGRVIGSVNLTWTSGLHRQAEFGFVLATDAQGQGYAGEAVTMLLDVAFTALDLHRAFARVDARNAASLRMLGRLGLRQEGLLVGGEFFKNEWTDIVIYAVLREEWALLSRRPGAP